LEVRVKMFRLTIEASKKSRITIGTDNKANIQLELDEKFRERLSETESDLAYLILSLFVYESLLKDGKKGHYYKKTKVEINGTEPIRIELSSVAENKYSSVSGLVKYTLLFTLGVSPQVSVVRPEFEPQGFHKEKVPGNANVGEKVDAVFLFSGGLDSLDGLSYLEDSKIKACGLFVSHGSAPLKSLVSDQLIPRIKNHSYKVTVVNVSKGSKGVQQLRGLVYFILGGLYAKVNGAHTLIVSEVGPTMYQPIYEILDEVTLTTHPVMVNLAKHFFLEMLNFELDIVLPFTDLTKAEALALIMDKKEYKEVAKSTNSCRNTRFAAAKKAPTHCGHCLGCIVRRISMIVTKIENNIEDYYSSDVLVKDIGDPDGRRPNTKISLNSMNDLLMLMNFSKEILLGKTNQIGYAKIRDYNAEELFRRFSLDVMSVLSILYGDEDEKPEGKGKNRYLKELYKEYKSLGIIDKALADKRAEEIKEKKYKPKSIGIK